MLELEAFARRQVVELDCALNALHFREGDGDAALGVTLADIVDDVEGLAAEILAHGRELTGEPHFDLCFGDFVVVFEGILVDRLLSLLIRTVMIAHLDDAGHAHPGGGGEKQHEHGEDVLTHGVLQDDVGEGKELTFEE